MKSRKKALKRYYPLLVLFLPVAAVFVIFAYVPLVNGFIMSFQEFRVGKSIFEMEFNNFENYKILFTDPTVSSAFRNTIVISVLKLVFGFFPPIFIAIFIFELRSKLYGKICQTLLYIPYFFSWVVVYGLFFAFFSTDQGFINVILANMHLEKIDFFTNSGWWLFLIVFSSVWKSMGWSSILYSAALTTINTELFEAARIDGCTPWKRIWYITFPSILPVINFSLIMSMAGILGSDFEQILMFYNYSVYEVGDVLSTWIYRVGLGSIRYYGQGTAVGIFNGVISLALMLAANFISRRTSGRGVW